MKRSRNTNNSVPPAFSARFLLGLSGALVSGAVMAAPVLEEVVVTAQKRTESMQDVPVAVSALTGDALNNTGFRDVTDLQAQVPSLIVTTNASPLNTSFRIRRIGNEGNIPTFEPDTALIIDGAFRSRAGMGLGDLVDIRAIEVLKGPQSTLYGKNAGAGVISISTQAPIDEFEASLEGSVGSEGYRQLKGAINLPISDRAATRFSYSGTDRDAMTENLTGPDFDDLGGYAIRGQLRFDLTDRLSSRLIIGQLERDMKPTMGDTGHSASQIDIIRNAGGQVTTNVDNDRVVEHDDRSIFDQQARDVVLNLEYTADAFTLTSITSYENYDAKSYLRGVEQMSLSIAKFDDTQAGTSFSQELRLASDPAATLNWLAGAFYYDNNFVRGDRDRPEFVLEEDIEEYGDAVALELAGLPVPVIIPSGSNVLGSEGDTGDFYVEQDTKSIGAFGQMTLSLTEALEITLGLRYSWEEKAGVVMQSNMTATGCGPTGTNIVCTVAPDGNNFDQTDDWSAVSGNVNLSYFLNDDTMLYALVAKGFKAGGFSLQFGGSSDELRPFDEEDIVNLEFGWKTELWDRRVRINGAIFHTEYEEFQNASFASLVFFVNNAELVTVDGIEVDSTWVLSESLTGNLNFAYIDAVYDEYTAGQCYYGRTDSNALGQCDLSGENLPFAPKLTANVALQWEQPLYSGDIYARVDYRYVGETNYSSELDPRHDEPAFGITNLRLGWRSAGFDMAAWVKNVSDETVYVQKVPGNITTAVDSAVGSPVGSYQTYLAEQRTYGVTFRKYF